VSFVFSAAQAETFTVAVLPDTQDYCNDNMEQNESINIFKGETQFIANNRAAMNIVFVSHLGDVVSHRSSYWAEWSRAVSAMNNLKNTGIPMGMAPGNHDYDDSTDGVMYNSTYWNSYFGPSTSYFSGKSWYGGACINGTDTSGMSSWQTFSAGGIYFLHIAFELDPSDDVLAWADNLIATHPNYRVIITNHAYMSSAGNRYQPPSTLRATYPNNSSQEVWDEFIKTHSQIFMVLCGHSSGTYCRVDNNNDGHKVYQIESDYQNVPSDDGSGNLGLGGGWFRLMEFDTDTGAIHIRTYSSLHNKYSNDPLFTDGSEYARYYAPFNYDGGGTGDLYPQDHPKSSDFYIYNAFSPNVKTHIDGVYNSFDAASVSTIYKTTGLSFDRQSTAPDGNYDKLYMTNYSSDPAQRGLYAIDIYNGSYGSRIALSGVDSPIASAVDFQNRVYVTYTGTSSLWRVTNLSGIPETTQIVANNLMGSVSASDDDPFSMGVVPNNFGGGFSAGTDVIVFDNGVDNNYAESVYVVRTITGNSTILWTTGNDGIDNNLRGAVDEYGGYAYWCEGTLPSETIEGLVKYYIYRVNGNGVYQKIYFSLSFFGPGVGDGLAVNPADGSVWLPIVNADDSKSIIRLNIADATAFNGSNLLADWGEEFVLINDNELVGNDISMNGMVFSPDGKLLAIAGYGSGVPADNKIVVLNVIPLCKIGYTDGDLNGDCRIDFGDFAILAANWTE
jgi:hypothetical protein